MTGIEQGRADSDGSLAGPCRNSFFGCCSICAFSRVINTLGMEPDSSQGDVLPLLDPCSRDDGKAPDCRPLLARIHNGQLSYDYLASSGPVHGILKPNVFLSDYCLFHGWFKCWKVIAESDPLRALTATDTGGRNPLHYACPGEMVRRSKDAGCYEQLERWFTRADDGGITGYAIWQRSQMLHKQASW
jgi:hypothetical protein